MTTIVDTDTLLGLVDPTDALHARAKTVTQQFAHHAATMYILPTTLTEFTQIAVDRLGFKQTQGTIAHFHHAGLSTFPITEDVTQGAITLYQAQTSKQESLFDCFVMAAAKTLAADCIFSFDKGYTKNGFVLAEDFLSHRTP